MAKNPEMNTPPAERSTGEEPGAPAPPGAPVSPDAAASKRPKSPREFIQERMRELDKKGS
jgi:hypothetical protein